EVVAKNRAPATEEKSSAKWKPFAITALVFLAIALALALAFRSTRTAETKSAAVEPTSTISAQPTPTIVVQPTPTPIAVAAVPSPTPTEPPVEATPSPTPKQVNKKEPSPRNNRAWQVWMDEFVHNFIASNESNDLDLAVSFYAANVDLFEEGKKPADAIRRDVESYNARWPTRRATIRGDVRLSEKAPNRTYTASFEHDYYVENASRGEWINGAVAVDLQITVPSDGVPKIFSMKQKTLRKEKGTMQPR
ncbi:MAG: hypothetical protein QOG51_2114, partial [Verrucomicrobiota bacterium]